MVASPCRHLNAGACPSLNEEPGELLNKNLLYMFI